MSAGSVSTLVHILGAGGASEPRQAGTGIGVARGVAGGTVAARLGGAMVHLLALGASKPRRALAAVGVEGEELTGGTVHTRVRVTGVSHRDLAERRLVADRTTTVELGARQGRDHVAGATVLTPRARTVLTRVEVLTVFSNILVRAPEGENTTVLLHSSYNLSYTYTANSISSLILIWLVFLTCL